MSNEKLDYIFNIFDRLLTDKLLNSSDGKITSLEKCDRGEKGAPVFIDWTSHRSRCHSFYCWAELDGNVYGEYVELPGILTEEEYGYILDKFYNKYPGMTALNENKIKSIFEKADTKMENDLRIKTKGALGIGNTEGVFADTLLTRSRRHGFYTWVEFSNNDVGASYDGEGTLTLYEYSKVLDLFKEKYQIKVY